MRIEPITGSGINSVTPTSTTDARRWETTVLYVAGVAYSTDRTEEIAGDLEHVFDEYVERGRVLLLRATPVQPPRDPRRRSRPQTTMRQAMRVTR